MDKYRGTRLREVSLEYQPLYSFGNGEKERQGSSGGRWNAPEGKRGKARR